MDKKDQVRQLNQIADDIEKLGKELTGKLISVFEKREAEGRDINDELTTRIIFAMANLVSAEQELRATTNNQDH